MSMEKPFFSVIGGGSGTACVLAGLKGRECDVAAIMTMADSGGSNGVLREQFGSLPTSGIRQALIALSEDDSLLKGLFAYRFHEGEGFSGMNLGNLFLLAATEILGSLDDAIEESARLLSAKGEVIPISLDDVQLLATYEDGTKVVGEHQIDEPQHDGKKRIVSLETVPKTMITERAAQAISKSDVIILGPGDLYTNTIASLVVGGVVEAITSSLARTIFVVNLMTKYGEAYNYKASDYLFDLDRYLPLTHIDYILINSDTDFPAEVVEKYLGESAIPVIDDLDHIDLPSTLSVVRKPLVSRNIVQPQKGDRVRRSMIRHDPEKLGNVIFELIS